MRAQLPEKLNRRALIQCFDRVSESRWTYLFLTEKKNGLNNCRVEGPYSKAYYATTEVIKWLVMEGYYTPAEFSSLAANTPFSVVTVRKHVMAG